MSDVRSGRVIAGKYRLEAILARGGMGSVWRARHEMLETPVAIKFIGTDVFALPEARRRFEREAKAAALLQSPHVVRIHDYGLEGDLPYLVMELLEGEDLGTTLKRQGKLDAEDTSNIVFQVARALRRAAEAGIVHRDLKPSNVFVIHDDEEDLVKVLDFGIAKAPRGLRSDDESTRKGAIIGSPRYMSPEQARGSPLVDPRSDLWSLAVIAYRAVTGELPFQSLDMTDLIVKICTEDPIPPSKIDPTLGPEMDAFFAKALDRHPDRRFQTAKELAAAFAVAAGQPPPSVSSRRILVRHPSGQLLVPDSGQVGRFGARPRPRRRPRPPSPRRSPPRPRRARPSWTGPRRAAIPPASPPSRRPRCPKPHPRARARRASRPCRRARRRLTPAASTCRRPARGAPPRPKLVRRRGARRRRGGAPERAPAPRAVAAPSASPRDERRAPGRLPGAERPARRAERAPRRPRSGAGQRRAPRGPAAHRVAGVPLDAARAHRAHRARRARRPPEDRRQEEARHPRHLIHLTPQSGFRWSDGHVTPCQHSSSPSICPPPAKQRAGREGG